MGGAKGVASIRQVSGACRDNIQNCCRKTVWNAKNSPLVIECD